jgi:NADP-dependent 3-hydroxy acid dehydrogenase YdfG
MLDSNRLDGKVALITGAAGEIGAATVKLMIARIVAVDRDKAALMRLSDELERPAELIPIEGDVTDEGSVAGFVARESPLAKSISSSTMPGSRGRSVRLRNIHSPTFAACST